MTGVAALKDRYDLVVIGAGPAGLAAAAHALELPRHIVAGTLPGDTFQSFTARRFDVQKAA